tara:strand:- start:16349 stop:17614 length:1266 start_codon:yes stop_codon:yes gene_type:complete
MIHITKEQQQIMHIAFRVDSSTIIGYGHVMRCLTLADALSHELKAENKNILPDNLLVSFICREHSGHINHSILDAHFNLITLPNSVEKIDPKDSNTWLGVTVNTDVQQCIAQLNTLASIDLLVVDHYAIDHHWHILMKPYYQKLCVLDDLANRIHACDYLLDQTFNRQKQAYRALVPEHCQFLLGQDYMLLREEFSLLRDQTKRHREQSINKYNNSDSDSNRQPENSIKVLISMGGTDPDNLSQLALNAIDALIQPSLNIAIKEAYNITAEIVISSQSIHLTPLTIFCNERNWANLIIDTKNMASLMLSADIAIGACGGTAWERCCLGLPCLTTVNAENQQLIADNLTQAGAIINLGWHQEVTAKTIMSFLMNIIKQPKMYKEMVEACFNVCDGEGAKKVAKQLNQNLNIQKNVKATAYEQ